MKTFCLIPSAIAEKHFSLASMSKERTFISPPTVATNLPPASKIKDKPSLDSLLRVALPPSQHDYGLSFLKLLDQNPNVGWNENGDLDHPFKGLNVINLISTLSNRKAKFPSEQKPLVKMFFNLTGLNPLSIKNSKEKVDLVGGGKKVSSRGGNAAVGSWVAY